MKNLSVGMKLIVGFGIVLLLMLLSIGMSFYSISSIGTQVELYGQYTVPNNTGIWAMRRDMVSAQRYVLLAFSAETLAEKQSNLELAQKDGEALLQTLDQYANNQRNTDQNEEIEKVKTLLDQAGAIRRQIGELVLTQSSSDLQKAHDLFTNQYGPTFDQAAQLLISFSETADSQATQQQIDAKTTEDTAWLLLTICIGLSLIFTILVVLAIRRSIMTPVKEIVSVFEEISKGNMDAAIHYQSRDELGTMAKLIQQSNRLQSTIMGDVIEKLTKISQGDLRLKVDLDYPGDFAVLKQTMETTVSRLNETMHTISSASEQVSMGAEQVASGAQGLAAGSTEQASSVEELTVTISQIAEQAAENSFSVRTATQFVEQAGAGVHTGNAHMKMLSDAMTEIGSASDQITLISKAIEDIAFQTNILALNATIEAARAGSAGKGFAVVADEVRNLAAKSAEAAKQTSELIQASTASVKKGMEITAETAQILEQVGDKAKLVNESILRIDQASAEQASAIEQVKQGLAQVSSVVQTNAATAQENSATSEEMSAQAITLREEVSKFKVKTRLERAKLDFPVLKPEIPKVKFSTPPPATGLGKY